MNKLPKECFYKSAKGQTEVAKETNKKNAEQAAKRSAVFSSVTLDLL